MGGVCRRMCDGTSRHSCHHHPRPERLTGHVQVVSSERRPVYPVIEPYQDVGHRGHRPQHRRRGLDVLHVHHDIHGHRGHHGPHDIHGHHFHCHR
ncbi:unnamed protein product [Allacma fusca]|uniref:Uncharacterized protein n=1 Tax=Allacma fusca TaxID=39272 RepID=A0A8J2PLC2_9HEXA|nr:unnamed protein product [Allacma fusca]